MSSKVLTPQRFLLVFLGALMLICSPLLLSYRYLHQYGETLSPAKITDEMQRHSETYYRSAMHDNLRETALELLRRRQPEIIALGSSLSYAFRQEYFANSFGCGCGVMDSISEGEDFVDQLIESTRPKIVLFVLDFWWFTDPAVVRRGNMTQVTASPLFSFAQLRVPYKQLTGGQITLSQFLGLAPLPATEIVKNPPLGLMANLDNVGRRLDGSQLNGLVFSPRAWDFYAPVRERLAAPEKFIMQPGRFGPDLSIHSERIAILKRTTQKLRDHGAHVILIYPPMAPQIVTAMEKSAHHGHFFDLARKIEALGLEFYDCHSASALGIEPAEFSDTHHGGNTAYMRILSAILKKNPASPLAKFVNQNKITRWAEDFRGTTVAVFEQDHINVAETDFLGLGTAKDRAAHLLKSAKQAR